MRISEIIAKAEVAVIRATKTAAVKLQQVNHDIRVERRASIIADGKAEQLRLANPVTLHAVDAEKAKVEAAEIEARANAILLERALDQANETVKEQARSQARQEAAERREYARKVLAGEIDLPR